MEKFQKTLTKFMKKELTPEWKNGTTIKALAKMKDFCNGETFNAWKYVW